MHNENNIQSQREKGYPLQFSGVPSNGLKEDPSVLGWNASEAGQTIANFSF